MLVNAIFNILKAKELIDTAIIDYLQTNIFSNNVIIVNLQNNIGNKNFASVVPNNLSILIGTCLTQTFTNQANLVYDIKSHDGVSLGK